MYQILFHLPDWLPKVGGMPVYGYGVMLVVGFFASLQLTKFLARRSGIDPEIFVNAGLIALVSGVVGARLSHVLENRGEYTRTSVAVASADADSLFPSPGKADRDAEFTLYGLSGPNEQVLGRSRLAQGDAVGFRRDEGRLVAVAGGQSVPVPGGKGRWERHVGAWENLVNAANIRSGGLTFYGGFLLATACTIAYGLKKNVSVRVGMDIVAPCLMIGLGIGRVGCFLNGCCYGAEADPHRVPWAMKFPYYSNPYLDEYENHRIEVPERLLVPSADGRLVPMSPAEIREQPAIDRKPLQELAARQQSLPIHPAQLYSTVTALLIAAFLVACYTLPHVPGRIFALMLLIEAPTRYVLEMLRNEPAVVGRHTGHLEFLPPQSFSMVLSAVLFAAGVVLWLAFRGKKEIPGHRYADAVGLAA